MFKIIKFIIINKHVHFIVGSQLILCILILLNYNMYMKIQQSSDLLEEKQRQLYIINTKIKKINNDIKHNSVYNKSPYFDNKKEISINDLQTMLLKIIENEKSSVVSFQSNDNDNNIKNNNSKIESNITFETNNENLYKRYYIT